MEITSVERHDEQGQRTRLAKTSAQDVGAYIKQLALIDPAVWNSYQALRKAGGQVFVVGGAIRDALMQKEPKDIDLMVTGVPEEEVHHALEALPGRVDLTGKSFGVYRYNTQGHEVEIALPRTEKSTGDRRVDFDVKVDHNLPVEHDLLRRDFTVNAMAVNLDTGKLVDPYGGAKAIEDRHLTTTHPNSFAEDPTRLIRALVMNGRYGFHPDERTRQEMNEHADRLPLESAEAKKGIIEKLMASNDPARALRLGHDTGILKHIFPEVDRYWDYDQNNPHHNFTLGEHLMNVLHNTSTQSKDVDLRLAALLHDIGKPDSRWDDPVTGIAHYYKGRDGQGEDHGPFGARMAEKRLRDLNWPVARIKRIEHLIHHHMFPDFGSAKGARKFLHRVGDEHADDLLTLRWADHAGKGTHVDPAVEKQRGLVEAQRSAGAPIGQSALEVNGNDIMALGIPAGPAIGVILKHLTNDVVENPALNDRAALLQRAKEYADALPS
jgi:tRNA nucleotidyltransferase (CCA-adding enzyme)